MKNRIKNYILLFIIAFAITPLYAVEQAEVNKEVATAQAIAQEVSKDIILLDQIVEQAEIIVNSTHSKERGVAKRELTRLMNHKDLDQKVKAAIDKDIKIIQNKSTSKDAHDAFDRLLAISDKIEAEANAVAGAAQAAKAVETASPEELEKIVAEAQKNMQEADQEVKEEQSMVRRLYSRAKRWVTAPVDYVFGEESSKAKTAFYAAVGAATVAAITYKLYRYGVEDPTNVLVPGLSFMIRKDNPENLKSAFIGRFQTLTNLQKNVESMDPARKSEYLKYNSHWLTDMGNDVNALEKALSVFISKDAIEEIKNKVQAGEYSPNQQILRDSPFGVYPGRRFFGLNPFYE